LGHKNALRGVAADFGAAQVSELIEDLLNELRKDLRDAPKRTSRQNWRFERITNIDPANESPETKLEKALARFGGDEWANQVPSASGLFKSTPATKKNIDIAHRRESDDSFDFVELKIESDTPLYAAFEILLNGVLYLLARELCGEKRTEGFCHGSPLLRAKGIHLRVLAPPAYYEAHDREKLRRMEEAIDAGIRGVAQRYGLAMSFGFRELGEPDQTQEFDIKVFDEALVD
jgi:hypothetical protein